MPEIVDKSIGDLPVAATMDDDSLIPGQQQGGSVSYTGRVLKAYAEDAGRKAAEHIKQGPPGEDFKILGYFATLAALEAAVPAPDAGDAYGVGAAAPYDIYVYDGIGLDWVNNGSIQGPAGPQGPQGEKGETGEQGPRGETGETGPQGEQGIQGETGATGPVGPTGPEGPQGPKGETGAGFKVLDYYASLSALQEAVPAPSVGDAYGIGTAEPYDIYIYGATSGWVNNGPLQGAKGDTGEQGPVGPEGPQGEQGPEGPQGIQGEPGPKGETGATGPEGPQGPAGADGKNGADGAPATINGVNTLTITTDEYLSADQDGDTLKLGLKSAPSSMGAASYALSASAWAQDSDGLYAQTVTVAGVTTDPEQVIVVDVQQTGTDTEADTEALAAWAGEEGSGPASWYVTQGSGTLTFHAKEAPTVNIPLNIAVGVS